MAGSGASQRSGLGWSAEAARLFVALASDETSFTTGGALDADGGKGKP